MVSFPPTARVPELPTPWHTRSNSASSSAFDSPDAVVNAPVDARFVPKVPCVVSRAAANVNAGVPVVEMYARATTLTACPTPAPGLKNPAGSLNGAEVTDDDVSDSRVRVAELASAVPAAGMLYSSSAYVPYVRGLNVRP